MFTLGRKQPVKSVNYFRTLLYGSMLLNDGSNFCVELLLLRPQFYCRCLLGLPLRVGARWIKSSRDIVSLILFREVFKIF